MTGGTFRGYLTLSTPCLPDRSSNRASAGPAGHAGCERHARDGQVIKRRGLQRAFLTSGCPRPGAGEQARAGSGGDVGVGHREVGQAPGVLELEAERLLVVALEHGDVQGQREERVRAELEQLRVVMPGQGRPLYVVELQPGGALGAGHVQDDVGSLGLPPLDGAPGVFPVPLDELGVAVDGVEELVQQVLRQVYTPD
jgi:hypothetical protein